MFQLGHVFAVDASNGEILWKVAHEQSSDPNLRKCELIKCTTPLYKDGMVYVTGGYDTGGMMIKIAADGKSATVAWTDPVLDNHHGGVVLVNGYIYGSNWLNNNNGNWCCIDWKTGKKMWEEPWNCKGSIISAEGMLYIYDERNGNVGLLKANPEKFDLVSSFKVTLGDIRTILGTPCNPQWNSLPETHQCFDGLQYKSKITCIYKLCRIALLHFVIDNLRSLLPLCCR